MQDKTYVPFTEEMKKDYTILVPNMLPMHFKLIMRVLGTYGYKMELLGKTGPEIAETGLKYTHNDACYPAVLVIGQFMEALLSGRYDPKKTALIMFQTGGGCRASNYISLIRKALKKADMDYIPVISFSIAGIEKHPGFNPNLKMYRGMMYGVLCADLLMSLVNSVRPYETEIGSAQKLAEEWTNRLGDILGASKSIKYEQIKKLYAEIISDFAKIPVFPHKTYRVGVVGEIFVKYSPLANNGLEDFLIKEGAEPVVPGLIDFCLYSIYNTLSEYEYYGNKALVYPLFKFIYKYLIKKKNDIIEIMKNEGTFLPWTPFEKVVSLGKNLISTAVKMGEGWLLTAEMLELAESGCSSIVCTQPFGCLPNHICGKGMMKPIRELCPDVNIVAIDYDPGASRVNQENRLKLMLANAKKPESDSPSVTEEKELSFI